jgi:hypothetical protein
MRRKPLIVLVAIVALAVIAVPALSAIAPTGHTATATVTVKPSVGTPHTRFVVTFLTPRHVGPAGAFATRYAVTASDRRQRGCASTASAMIASSRQGFRLKLSLDPPRGSSWCAGNFSARIQEYQTPVCGPLRLCPQFIRFVGTVGKFSFRVERAG